MKIALLIFLTILYPVNLDEILSSNSNSSPESKNIDNPEFNIYNDLDYIILDQVIDPYQYKVGPGDNLSFNLISSDGSISLVLTVSPLGDVLIPNIGNIMIDDMLLIDAISEIKVKCKEKYNSAEVFISLHSYRQFNVQVFGPGILNGYLKVSPIHRLSHVFSEIIKTNDYIYSMRNIEVLKEDIVYTYDLLDFFVFGNEMSNPYIEQNDKIKISIQKNIISSHGGVNIPGVYDYKKNQTLENLIQISGGFTNDADSNYIEITRFVNDDNFKLIKINNYVSNKSLNLLSHDDVRIRIKKEFKRSDYITIKGEVNYPGRYLLSEVESYEDIINLAGGFTAKADSNQITINNHKIQLSKDLELERIQLIPSIDRTPSEKSYVIARKKIIKGGIHSNDKEFSDYIKNNIPKSDDEIIISEKIDYIEIIGAVLHPGRFDYEINKKLSNYILDAGGYTSNSSNQKYLIKSSDGKRIKLSKNPLIESGDIIFISSKEDYNTFIRFKEVLQILGNFAALIAVIQSTK